MDDAFRDVIAHPLLANELRKADWEASFADDACVRRYLRANDGNVQKASKALATTLQWRREMQPWQAECSACMKDPHSHNLRIVGCDTKDRPILYTCFSQAMCRFSPEQNIEHMLRSLEDACTVLARRGCRLGGKAANAESCVWIIDFHGYSFLGDSNPRTAVLGAQLLAHYPERLGKGVMLDAPSLFSSTWRIVRGIINNVTAAKICFVRSDDGSFEREMKGWADDEMQRWLMAEISDNRKASNQRGGKAYWTTHSNDGSLKLHDARGVRKFVESPEFDLLFTSTLSDKPNLSTHKSEHLDHCTGKASSAVASTLEYIVALALNLFICYVYALFAVVATGVVQNFGEPLHEF